MELCSEPSNVAAGGEDCPVRFRCVGCAHFSTDMSFLPDLEGYLADLLRTREKLLGLHQTQTNGRGTTRCHLEEWIASIRRLIARIKADVDELSEAERTQVEEAVSVVRRAPKRRRATRHPQHPTTLPARTPRQNGINHDRSDDHRAPRRFTPPP